MGYPVPPFLPQTALIRQQSKAHVEERLVGKEKELLAVRQKLEEVSLWGGREGEQMEKQDS